MEWLRGVALDDGLLDATSVFGVVLGEILLRQGRAGSAARIFQDSCGLLAERDLFGYRPWALAGLARARALCGEPDSAAVLLDDARRSQAIGRHYDMSLFLADVELHRVAGRTDAAVAAARAAVAWARDAGMAGYEAQALESWWRTAPSDEAAARLGELVAVTDSALVAALAAYARADLASDAPALLAVADRFASMGVVAGGGGGRGRGRHPGGGRLGAGGECGRPDGHGLRRALRRRAAGHRRDGGPGPAHQARTGGGGARRRGELDEGDRGAHVPLAADGREPSPPRVHQARGRGSGRAGRGAGSRGRRPRVPPLRRT